MREEEWMKRLRRTAATSLGKIPSEQDREDVLQEIMMEGWTWRRRVGEAAPVPEVAARLLIRQKVATHWRKHERYRTTESADALQGAEGGEALVDGMRGGGDVELTVQHREQLRIFIEEMNKVNNRQLIVMLRRRCFEGTPLEDLAREMGIEPNTLAQRLSRLRAKLIERAGAEDLIPPLRAPSMTDLTQDRRAADEVKRALGRADIRIRQIHHLLGCLSHRRRSGVPDWESIAGSLQRQGYGCISSRTAADIWAAFKSDLPDWARRAAEPLPGPKRAKRIEE